ncbi:hypothetical protein MEO93_20855, partial [Dolichospermum sp. ST_sed3]|nr:hypothetical protein [Dolichospermum sp. ST_sed3]
MKKFTDLRKDDVIYKVNINRFTGSIIDYEILIFDLAIEYDTFWNVICNDDIRFLIYNSDIELSTIEYEYNMYFSNIKALIQFFNKEKEKYDKFINLYNNVCLLNIHNNRLSYTKEDFINEFKNHSIDLD